ncbi:MAG: hypothetical protein GEU98_07020 [Pseudonocardiaceae bacterium]|nr:hypothetical protein [Pseudonocardiaceae bacterium]
MIEHDGPVLYAERGASWWPLLWAPAFVLIGLGLDIATGPVHLAGWLLSGLGLLVVSVVWIHARRRFLAVLLTRTTLRQGRETLEVRRIAEVSEVGTPVGARVLGGALAVPRKYHGVPLKLDDGSVVLGWARDGESLQAALREIVEP